jgi:anti-sigma regulatory factor (Ser/Thr protein kinase)
MDGIAPLITALTNRSHQWVCPTSRAAGVYRTYATPEEDDLHWVKFGVAVQFAAVSAGFSRNIAAQLVGAIGEMQSNVYEHSQAPETGIVAFRGRSGTFEFVVCDSGIGALKSLTTCPEFQQVSDHGEALRLTLSDGVSRHGRNAGRGLGFQPLFTGLVNLNGALRFRSGDYALTIEGKDPRSLPARLWQKPRVRGFLASVTCRC